MNSIYQKLIEDCIYGLNSLELAALYRVDHEKMKALLEFLFSNYNFKIVAKDGIYKVEIYSKF